MYEIRKFDIPPLDGISTESVKQHIGLYEGYVKNFNAMTVLMDDLFKESDTHAHELAEIIRRRAFEFDGMRLHELYFPQFEGGAMHVPENSPLATALSGQFGSVEEAIRQIRISASLRGPGWSLLYYDPSVSSFRIGFAGEQHQGHFATLPIILALDVWEHAYLLDYGAQGKGGYIDAFFKNLNWTEVEKRFDQVIA